MPWRRPTAAEERERSRLLPIHILRPCLGKGKGRHLYEAKMLQENAHKFAGWRQFIDHLSPEARKAAKGLPRSIRDLGGRIVESYWDADVPSDEKKGFEQGAVVGWSLPTPFVRELAENDPELIEASISANATGVQPIMRDGRRAWLVEGIEDRGSVDWVTEAGAGGRVVALMEAAYEEDGMELLESMTDEEFIAYVEEVRPHLLVEQSDGDAEDAEDGGDDELEEMVARLMKRNPKLSRAQAETMAKQALKKSAVAEALDTEEDDMGAITPEALQEALQSEDFRTVLDPIIEERVKTLVESAVADERELIRAEARADADRQLELRDMRDEAHRQICEAKLPDAFASRAKAQFEIKANGPTPGLDVVDDVDDDGKVTKKAAVKLQESVDAAIQDQRELLAAANPTAVRGQGPGAPPSAARARRSRRRARERSTAPCSRKQESTPQRRGTTEALGAERSNPCRITAQAPASTSRTVARPSSTAPHRWLREASSESRSSRRFARGVTRTASRRRSTRTRTTTSSRRAWCRWATRMRASRLPQGHPGLHHHRHRRAHDNDRHSKVRPDRRPLPESEERLRARSGSTSTPRTASFDRGSASSVPARAPPPERVGLRASSWAPSASAGIELLLI